MSWFTRHVSMHFAAGFAPPPLGLTGTQHHPDPLTQRKVQDPNVLSHPSVFKRQHDLRDKGTVYVDDMQPSRNSQQF